MKISEQVDEDKLRGGFYTPEPVAKFILRWATNGNKDYDILEPSCGDGVFLKQVKEQEFEYESITGVEIIDEEVEKARKIELSDAEILNKDFLD